MLILLPVYVADSVNKIGHLIVGRGLQLRFPAPKNQPMFFFPSKNVKGHHCSILKATPNP